MKLAIVSYWLACVESQRLSHCLALVRPRTMERRHEELQKAIQAELQERQMARMADQGSTSLGGYPDPHVPQEHTATGWAGQGRHTSVHVETPRFHTRY